MQTKGKIAKLANKGAANFIAIFGSISLIYPQPAFFLWSQCSLRSALCTLRLSPTAFRPVEGKMLHYFVK